MSAAALASALEEALPGRVTRDAPLAPLTTYRLGGPAAVLIEPQRVEDVSVVAGAVRRARDVPLLVLGRGSNTVVSDEGWPGVVLHAGPGLGWVEEGEGEGSVVAGAGTPMPQLANWAARRGLSGLEFLVSIPGSVGGGVRMNAGAHGAEVADRLVSASVLDLDACTVTERAVTDLGMSYRRSALDSAHFVIDARFSLEPASRAAIRERMESFRRHRAATQPGAALNAGSVFKNPPGDHAGRLVDALGLKGFAVGGARVSDVHANFFVARPGATAQDVFDLVHAVRAKVEAATGIALEPEVRFAGSFRAPASTGAGS